MFSLSDTCSIGEIYPDVWGQRISSLSRLDSVQWLLRNEVSKNPIWFHLREQTTVAIERVGGGF